MGKHGMKERVTKNPDPTFSEVLGIFREEAREIKEKQKAAELFRGDRILRHSGRRMGTNQPYGWRRREEFQCDGLPVYAH